MTPWWRNAVVYQIYPRSWMDSNADGIGDLPGILQRLDYLAWLGVDALWLNPVMPSPNDDWGYDVSDFCAIHPDLGTLDDLDRLVAAADARGLRILLDLVPNHTSDRHPWFVEASASRSSDRRGWYVWADPAPGGGPPNNWLSVFGGEGAWEWHAPTRQYYLHNFLRSQPDLNWWDRGVREAFHEVLHFWFRRGISGFRIDVAHALVKDRRLRDNPPADDADHPEVRRLGQKIRYNMNRPESHDVLRDWRSLARGYETERLLVGETYVLDLEALPAYLGDDDELHLAFNFPFVFSELGDLRAVAERTLQLLPQGSAAWFGSNHDVGRFPTRWCRGSEVQARVCLMMLLALEGTTFLLYGDELGMPDTRVGRKDLRDPVGKRFWPRDEGRDRCRTPMQWEPRRGAGFTRDDVRPWLPLGDVAAHNVAVQRRDPGSMLHLCRDLIALGKHEDMRREPYIACDAPDGAWVWRRGAFVVALNLSDEPVEVAVDGEVVLSSTRARDGSAFAPPAALDPWEGIIVRRSGG